ncbi:MAG: DsbA family protein [Alphaproteobacteria bacterium]
MRRVLAASLIFLGACTAALADNKAAIEQAYARKLEAQRIQDVEQRIAARQQLLENASASPVLGNPAGNVVIVEFFDYACPYCKAVEPRLEALLKSDRKVKLVLKEFPILTPQSMIATRAALAAVRQGKYRPFHEAMMNFRGQLLEADIFDMARASGLDIARLRKDMTAPEISDEIIANFNLARGIRVFQTPAFIVGGKLMNSESAAIDFPKAVADARRR